MLEVIKKTYLPNNQTNFSTTKKAIIIKHNPSATN